MKTILQIQKLKEMKKLMIVAAMFIAVIANAQAPQQPIEPQGNGNKGDKIEALRIAFISQQLNLTPQEAQKFWPVYNQFRGDMKTLHQNFKLEGNLQLTAEQQLDLEQNGTRDISTADGKSHKVPYVGPVKVTFENRICFVGAIVLGDEPLLGAVPMEDMDLVIHPLSQTLIVNPESPNFPHHKVK